MRTRTLLAFVLASAAAFAQQKAAVRPHTPPPVRNQTRQVRKMQTPFERLFAPEIAKRSAQAAAAMYGKDPHQEVSAAVSTGVTPNFGGFISPSIYPGEQVDACTVDPYNCGNGITLSADFNGDGKQDVADVQFDGTLNVLIGDGTGALAEPVTYASPDPANLFILTAYASDLNKDGKPDVIALDYYNNDVIVYMNKGDGTFASAVTTNFSFDYGSVGWFAMGDVNGDGKPDVVLAENNTMSNTSSTVTVQVALGNGDGTFAQPTTAQTSTISLASYVQFVSVALGDFNADGKLDVVVSVAEQTGQGSGDFLALPALGDGTGSFAGFGNTVAMDIPAAASIFGPTFSSSGVHTAVLTSSGNSDIAMDADGSLYTATSNGDGSFAAAKDVLDNIYDDLLTFADMNNDGKQDVVNVGDAVGIYLGNGDGTFQATGSYYIADAGGVTTADLNGDGKQDVITTGGVGKYAVVMTGNGDGTVLATPLLAGNTPSSFSAPGNFLETAGDINGDGIDDIVFVDYATLSINTALSDGKGGYTFKVGVAPSLIPTLGFIEPFTADFNGDGRRDIVLSNTDGTATIAFGNADGTFTNPTALPIPQINCEIGYGVAGDVNGDGKQDIVLAYEGDKTCSIFGTTGSGYVVLLGNGDGTFQSGKYYSFGTELYSVALGDFNGDGKQDILLDDTPFAGGADFGVSLANGNGDGTFGNPALISQYYEISQMLVGDFSGDGKLDVVLLSAGLENTQSTMGYSTAGAITMVGRGDGSFGNPTIVGNGVFFENGVLADVNNDGLADLVLPIYTIWGTPTSYRGLPVLLSTGDGGFSQPINTLFPVGSQLAFAGNFYSDNATDVVVQAPAGIALLYGTGGTKFSLAVSSNSVNIGDTVTLTATVAAAMSNRPAPTGTVTFYAGTTVLGTAQVSNGTATFSTSALAAGTYSVTAVYSGDANFNQATSGAQSVTVVTVPPAFALAGGAASLTITDGGQGVVNVTATANGAYSGTLTWSCSGLPSYATCIFSPSQVKLTPGATATESVVITTTGGSKSNSAAAATHTSKNNTPWGFGAGAVSLAGLLMFLSPRRRRLPVVLAILCMLAAPAMFLTGCDGSSSNQVSSSPKGTYNVTITAADGNGGTQSVQVSVTVD